VSGGRAIDVIVPSYGRPEALSRCIDALLGQEVEPARILVVVRRTDAPTRAVLDRFGSSRLTAVVVEEPGLGAALRRAVAASSGEIVALTDDDARPRVDWVRRLAAWFTRSDVGAVGGRDVVPGVVEDRSKVVGRLAPFGRMSGWHHVGSGAPSDVDVLKGVNLAVRAEALVLPRPGVLCDAGSMPHVEVLMCDAVRSAGWRVVYDPAILVDHDALPRVDSDRISDRFDPEVVRAVATNRIVAATVLDRRRLPVQLGYALAIGTREGPGLARTAAALLARDHDVAARLVPALAGHLAGAWRAATERDAVETCRDLRRAG
jgi:glycosyltransferase involved in cell wall biosynthesis